MTPCKTSPAQKTEHQVTRKDRSNSPKIKLVEMEKKPQRATSATRVKEQTSEPSTIVEALQGVSVLKLHCFLSSSTSENNFRFQLLAQCLQVILECIQFYVLNSNEKVDIRTESVNRIYMKLQNLKQYSKLPDCAQLELLQKLLTVGNKFPSMFSSTKDSSDPTEEAYKSICTLVIILLSALKVS